MENIIIGTLLNGEGVEQVDLLPTDFSFPHSEIFRTILELAEKNMPYDLTMVAEALEQKGILERIGGRRFLMSLLLQGTVPALLPSYVRTYRQKLHVARVRAALMEAYDALGQGVSVSEALAKVEAAVGEDPVEELDLIQHVSKVATHYETFVRGGGIPVPWPGLQKTFSGFRAGEVMVVGARPGLGKTSFLITLLYHWSVLKEVPTLLVSLEMSPAMIYERLLACASDTPTYLIRRQFQENKFSPAVEAAKTMVDRAPIDILSELEVTPSTLAHILRRRRTGYNAVFVDYIQLMNSEVRSQNRYEEVSRISRALKTAALANRVFLCTAAQLSRLADRAGDEPELDHLRDSSAIESDADYVLLLYQPEEEKAKEVERGATDNGMTERKIKAKLAKNRYGPTGVLDFEFIPALSKFIYVGDTKGGEPCTPGFSAEVICEAEGK